MKKNIKPVVLILALLMLCLGLTGCAELDTMREQHAVWTTAGSIESITYNGVEYKILPGNNHPVPAGYMYQPVFVTEPDVPVLLSSELSTYMNISEDGNFLTGFVMGNPEYHNVSSYSLLTKSTFTSGDGSEATYCKADIYDEIVAKINEGIEYTSYRYEYWHLDEETGYDDYDYYYLTDEEADAVNKVSKEVEPVEDSQIPYEYMWLAQLEKVSEDRYFSQPSYDIYLNDYNDTYYLVSYSPSLEIHMHYEVPKDMNDMFDKITQKASIERFFHDEDGHLY